MTYHIFNFVSLSIKKVTFFLVEKVNHDFVLPVIYVGNLRKFEGELLRTEINGLTFSFLYFPFKLSCSEDGFMNNTSCLLVLTITSLPDSYIVLIILIV